MTTANHKLSVSEKFGYGPGDLASNMFWQMFAIFMAKFYTDVFLLGAATMGTMMLVTRVVDAFFDPMIGTIADRTETRWGHFRSYLLWMAIPMGATAVLAFTVPDLDGSARTIYAYVTLMLMMFAYSAINIPYSALLGVLTPDSRERTSVTYFATFAMTRERVKPPPKPETSLKSDLKDLFRNRPWVVLCGVGIAALTFGNIRNTVTIFYFENVVPNGGGYFGPVMTTGAVAFILGVMATSPLGWAIGGAGAGWLLAFYGYLPNVEQSARTVHGIVLMMSIIPAVAAVAAVAALWFYEIDEDTVKRMSADLEARRAVAGHPEVVAGRSAADLSEAEPPVPARGAAPSAPRDPAPAGTQENGAPQVPPALSSQEFADLAGEFAETLQAGVHGMCFSPYLEGQSPGTLVDEAQIRARLGIIQPHTRWVRSFSCTDGHEHTPRIAHELGMKTLVGAWLGTDREVNEREIAGAIELARAGHVDILAVGNEVLLREDMSEDELLGYIERVKQAVPPGIPVGYVDAYYLFERHPRVTAACDVVLTNCYPFWEGCARDQAIPYMQSMYKRTVAVAGGKKVIISETGWPNTGSAFHGAVPSVAGAMRYFIDTYRWARQDGVEVFYFEAFDEAWKVGAEGDVGAYWGLWDKHGLPKYV